MNKLISILGVALLVGPLGLGCAVENENAQDQGLDESPIADEGFGAQGAAQFGPFVGVADSYGLVTLSPVDPAQIKAGLSNEVRATLNKDGINVHDTDLSRFNNKRNIKGKAAQQYVADQVAFAIAAIADDETAGFGASWGEPWLVAHNRHAYPKGKLGGWTGVDIGSRANGIRLLYKSTYVPGKSLTITIQVRDPHGL